MRARIWISMDTRIAFALVITTALTAAPAAAQTPARPAGTAQTPAPSVPRTPVIPDIPDIPAMPDIAIPALPAIPAFGDMIDVAAIMEAVRPALEMAADAPRIAAEARAAAATAPMMAAEARAAVDRLAFDFGQDRAEQRDRDAEQRDREREQRERERERESQWYSEGQSAADDYRWDRALNYFDRVAQMKATKVEGALYWKAFSQNRLGQRSEALTTIAELSKNYPNSPWRKQAAVLEAEVRRDIGQPVRPQDAGDDEVKLLALQALQNTSPEQAVPILEKTLEGTASPKVKQRALFVLAQSNSPRAREVLRNYAKGSSTPDLQSQAIRYLGVHGGAEAQAVLGEVYAATTDVDVKRRILRSFMTSGAKDRLLKAAQGEQNAELRAEAVNQLGNMGAQEELWQL